MASASVLMQQLGWLGLKPPTQKISDPKALLSLLRSAIENAQGLPSSREESIDVKNLSKWEGPLEPMFKQFICTDSEPNEAFSQCQSSLLSLAESIDQMSSARKFFVVIEDPSEQEAVALFFVRSFRSLERCAASQVQQTTSVLQNEDKENVGGKPTPSEAKADSAKSLPSNVPLIFLSFSYGKRSDPKIQEHMKMVQKIVNDLSIQKMKVTAASTDVVRCIAEILNSNSQRVTPEQSLFQKEHTKKYGNMTPSFIVPLQSLSNKQIDRLFCVEKKCASCSSHATSFCHQCFSSFFCDQCQTAGLKQHKEACITDLFEDMDSAVFPLATDRPLYTCNMVGREPYDHMLLSQNMHGSSRFVVKIQAPLMGGGEMMMVYDQTRSFKSFVLPSYSAHRPILRVVDKYPLRKGYFWAIRQGESLRVFLQSFPRQDQSW
mmetsp:Transcript_17891/g.29638  ORF Transcript_17891/g.29638 Transcript_17891/m.29638 type:complete len:434 (-) Transcript_17891:278-1579(-)